MIFAVLSSRLDITEQVMQFKFDHHEKQTSYHYGSHTTNAIKSLSTIQRRPPITMAITQQLMQFQLSTIKRRPPITMTVAQQLMQFPISFEKF